jgi:dUTPase
MLQQSFVHDFLIHRLAHVDVSQGLMSNWQHQKKLKPTFSSLINIRVILYIPVKQRKKITSRSGVPSNCNTIQIS